MHVSLSLKKQLMRALRTTSLSLSILGEAWAVPALLDFVNATLRFVEFYSPVTADQRAAFKQQARRPGQTSADDRTRGARRPDSARSPARV